MPQLAIESFVSQYFWLLVIFFSVYLYSITYIIPRISILFKSRNVSEEIKGESKIEGKKRSLVIWK